MTARLRSFEEFWPFYVSQHLDPVNQRLHFVGTTLVLVSLAAGVFVAPAFFAAWKNLGAPARPSRSASPTARPLACRCSAAEMPTIPAPNTITSLCMS